MKWDKGVPYEELKKRIIDEIKKVKDSDSLKSVTRLAYLIVYAIQLRNGSRISEAIDGFKTFLNNKYFIRDGKRIAKVRVRKKKKEESRELLFPEFISFNLVAKLRKYRVEVTVERAKAYAKRILGVNTHTLRYARVTYLAEKGINPAIIAKITHHTKLDFILKYTQERLAEKVNKEIF